MGPKIREWRCPRSLAILALGASVVPLWAGGQAQAQAIVSIPEIQGAGHISPYAGQEVTTSGVVTAVAFNGYYVQDRTGDGDDATSDALFVFKTGAKPAVGDHLQLTDTVTEFVPGGAATGNLSITQMSFPAFTVLSSGNPLPFPVVIGTGGRIPPNRDVISDDELPANLQTEAGLFDPERDGIDFYESLEGMLVTVEDPVAVSATRTFNAFSSELFVLPNDGAHIAPRDARTRRGGISLQPDPDNRGDQNPERVQIQLDGTLFPADVPAITVGDQLGSITGVVGYSFGNFEVNAIAEFDIFPAGLRREVTRLSGNRRKVTVATYNLLNLSPLPEDDRQRTTLASQIVDNLGSPDVIAVQEIQDNSGEIDDGTTDASHTLQALADSIHAAGGPQYAYFDVAPADGTSGGVPGGNIRNAFLYNPNWIELVESRSLTPDELLFAGVGDPAAFAGTRNPLMGVFEFAGAQFTVINNHLTSRFGSTPVFGGIQPFVQAGEAEREAQMQALNDYVDFLLDGDPGAAIIVLGDLNTFEFTNDLTEILPGTGPDRVLTNLIGTLGDDNVYSFNFEGNSQVLDHLLVSDALLNNAKLDIVHVNVDFPRVDDTVGSDHEPLVARLKLKGQDDEGDGD